MGMPIFASIAPGTTSEQTGTDHDLCKKVPRNIKNDQRPIRDLFSFDLYNEPLDSTSLNFLFRNFLCCNILIHHLRQNSQKYALTKYISREYAGYDLIFKYLLLLTVFDFVSCDRPVGRPIMSRSMAIRTRPKYVGFR